MLEFPCQSGENSESNAFKRDSCCTVRELAMTGHGIILQLAYFLVSFSFDLSILCGHMVIPLLAREHSGEPRGRSERVEKATVEFVSIWTPSCFIKESLHC